LNGYKRPKPNGAHFLIDKDGTIYQTASLHKKTHHVGWIKSRCIAEHSCSPAELQALKNKRPGAPIGRIETKKSFPRRYPFNEDSIGIENVGEAFPKNGSDSQKKFEPLTSPQQESLLWLVRELTQTLAVPMSEVFRHSEVSWKLETEAGSARW
jgi:N-acetyl-anhydromuramyl-L-alanine amidase AmpD